MEIKEVNIAGEKAYLLQNEVLEVVISSLGAGIYSLKYQGKEMVVVPNDFLTYCYSDGYFGKTVGRIAGRIEKGILNFDGNEYHLSTNENGNTLHSGGTGFSFQRFEGEIKENELVLSFNSEDGDGGFPGNLHLDVIYSLFNDSLLVRFESTSDIDTPVNFTNHSYFNLGEDSVSNLSLRLASNEVENYKEGLIPLGLEKVKPCLDFRKRKKISEDINDPYLYLSGTSGYDHCFFLNEEIEGEPPISLSGRNVRMDVFSTLPAVQIYSSNFFPMNVMMNTGKLFYAHHSVAIEPVYVPYDYKSMMNEKNIKKINSIRYRFSKI